MPEKTKLNRRLEKMFLKTKLLCFGRYALEVPVESKLIIGSNTIDVEEITTNNLHFKIEKDIEEILKKTRAQKSHTTLKAQLKIVGNYAITTVFMQRK